MICDYCCKSNPDKNMIKVKWGNEKYVYYYCQKCFPEVKDNVSKQPWYDGYIIIPFE